MAQFEQIENFVDRKREMASNNKGLSDLPLQLPVERSWAKNVYWMYGVVTDESTKLDAERLSLKLQEKGNQTRPFFVGIHQQQVFNKIGLFKNTSLPVTESISRQGLYLPSGRAISDERIETVIQAVRTILA